MPTNAPLQEKLDEITARTRDLVQPERLLITERAVTDLLDSGIERSLLEAGARAPDFALPDGNGRLVRSADLLALGPLVIKFFRGRWCPYCTTELEAWRDRFGELRQRGALLVAISPQSVRQNGFMASQHALPFPMLRDEGAVLAERFGAAYTVPQYMRDHYLSVLVNIPFVNGENSWRLPIPATFVVDGEGKSAWRKAMRIFACVPSRNEFLAQFDPASAGC
jgi:peroxiredoxin